MSETWMLVGFAAILAGSALFFLVFRRPVDSGIGSQPAFADPREERLVLRLARTVGCSPAQATPAVRREIEYSPNQPDDTLFKRALYHYRQDQPEKVCNVYRDQTRG